MEVKSGMTYQRKYNGKLKTYTVDKVGSVVTEYSCWGKYKTQYVWVVCCDGIETALSYDEVKERINQGEQYEINA